MLFFDPHVIFLKKRLTKTLCFFVFCFGVSFAGGVAAESSPEDPFEKFNRVSFWVTDQLDRFVLRPVTVGYTKVTPNWVEDRFRNFFDNLTEVNSFVNSALQLKPKSTGKAAGRFMINSTVGVLGFFDVAKRWGIYRQDEDFGQTLGHWGVPPGPYLFIPLLGPSSVRDAAGLVADSPWNPIPYMDHVPSRNGVFAFQMVDSRGRLLEFESLIMGDKYTFMRDFYLNHRIKQVADGAPDLEFEEDDFDDEFEDEFD